MVSHSCLCVEPVTAVQGWNSLDFKLRTKDLDEFCHTGKGRHEGMRGKK